MNRKIAIASIGALMLLVLGPATQALADDCLPLIESCQIDIGLADPDEIVDDPIGAVEDALDGAEDTTGPVVDIIVDVVDDLLPGDVIVDPPGGDDPSGHVGDGRPRVRGRERVNDGARVDPVSTAPNASQREAFRPTSPIIGSAASGARSTVPPHGAPGRFEGFVEAAVRGLLLLAVLMGVTMGFLLVQSRIDRHDPKLVHAPVRTEIVTFG